MADAIAVPAVVPNMPDYERACREFSWEEARRQLDGLPGGRGLNIAHECVDRHVSAGRGGKAAFVCLSQSGLRRTVTFAALKRDSNRFANVLVGLGLQPGDRIFAIAGRIPELVVAALGTLKAREKKKKKVTVTKSGGLRKPSTALPQGNYPDLVAVTFFPRFFGNQASEPAPISAIPFDNVHAASLSGGRMMAPEGRGRKTGKPGKYSRESSRGRMRRTDLSRAARKPAFLSRQRYSAPTIGNRCTEIAMDRGCRIEKVVEVAVIGSPGFERDYDFERASLRISTLKIASTAPASDGSETGNDEQRPQPETPR